MKNIKGQESTRNAFDNAADHLLLGNISKDSASRERVRRLAEQICEVYFRKTGKLYPVPVVAGGLALWIEKRIETVSKDFENLLCAPTQSAGREFREILASAMITDFADAVKDDNELVFIRAKTTVTADTTQHLPGDYETPVENLYTGFRTFSPKKLAAMIDYIVGKSNFIYRTKLSRLLFYADFVNFYQHYKSISGTKYMFDPLGPDKDEYEPVLSELEETGHLQIIPGKFGQTPVEKINTLPRFSRKYDDCLSRQERSTLRWVIKTLGQMDVKEISDLVPKDKIIRGNSNIYIMYSFSRFLPLLPKKSLKGGNVKYVSFTK